MDSKRYCWLWSGTGQARERERESESESDSELGLPWRFAVIELLSVGRQHEEVLQAPHKHCKYGEWVTAQTLFYVMGLGRSYVKPSSCMWSSVVQRGYVPITSDE